MTLTSPIARDTDGPVHEHFGLSYANYLVLPRTLLQSMPAAWQASFVQHLDQLAAAFHHLPQAEAYEVTAGTVHLINEVSDADLKAAGYSADWYGGEEPPSTLDGQALELWQAEHETEEPVYYDRNFNEVDGQDYVLVPCTDPVPHYNRGRTYIAPAIALSVQEV